MLLLLAVFSSITAFGQEQQFLEAFDKYRSASPTEKVYLHTDKEVYAPGERLWFAAYLVEGTLHLPSKLSEVVHVELLNSNDSSLVTISLKMKEGTGAGDILLGDTIPTGEYFIRGFTHYQRNFDPAFIFSKSIFLVNANLGETGDEPAEQVNSNHDFQYFPEGGDLIVGMVNQVAFKATNDQGKGVDVQGEIVDGNGNAITTFRSAHRGMGRLLFTPQLGTAYSFKYTIGGKDHHKPIKTPLEKGAKLAVRPTKTAFIITGNVTAGMDINDCFIVGHVRGQVYLLAKPEGREYIYAKVPNNRMPNGIIHLTMFHKGVPLQERLIFNENPDLLPNLQFAASNLQRRQKTRLEVSIVNKDGSPVQGKVSLSVLGENIRANQITIDSYLNAFSDLKGIIEDPAYYFNKNNPNRLIHLDMLLLTQGWRRFVWNDLLEGQLPEINYFAEKGFSIEGKVVDYYKRKKAKTGTVVLSFLENLLFNEEATTDEEGNFYFDGLTINDSVTVMVQAMRKGKKDRMKRETGAFVQLKTPDSLTNEVIMITKLEESSDEQFAEIIANVEEQTYTTDNVIELEEFTVAANKINTIQDSPFRRPSMLHGEPQSRMVMDSVPGLETYTHVFDMITGRLPGVQIRGTGDDRQAFIRGTQAAFMVDGVQTTNDYVSLMDPRSIEFVEVIGAIQAAVYGAGGPIVAFYTRQDFVADGEADPRGIQVFRHPGYYQAREFYTPNYDEMTTEEALAKDLRTTQYWSSIREIENGKVVIEYTASDDLGNFILYVEGITSEGEPFAGQYSFVMDDF